MGSPFLINPGIDVGRLKPPAGFADLGEYAFVFGSVTPGLHREFNIGDNLLLEQTADVTGIKLVRFRARVRSPSVEVSGCKWRFIWGVNATESGYRDLVGRELYLKDGAIDTSALVGNQTIRFRLKLVAA